MQTTSDDVAAMWRNLDREPNQNRVASNAIEQVGETRCGDIQKDIAIVKQRCRQRRRIRRPLCDGYTVVCLVIHVYPRYQSAHTMNSNRYDSYAYRVCIRDWRLINGANCIDSYIVNRVVADGLVRNDAGNGLPRSQCCWEVAT